MCKECVAHEFKRFRAEYNSTTKAMQRICMLFDIYYDSNIVRVLDGSADDTLIGNYIKKVNLGQYKGRTFESSIDEGFVFFDTTADISGINIDTPSKESVEKWGEGFTRVDYEELDKHYRELKTANPNGDYNQEIFIIDLCYIKMQQLKAVREGRVDDYSKLADTYRKSFQQAGLKTVRDNSASENFLLGVGAAEIEKYTPAEYYKDKKLYADHDELEDYFNRYVLRPLKNLQFGTNDRDTEFYVKDGDDSDAFTDEE